MKDIRVVVVDDQPIMSQALAIFIEAAEDMVCAGVASGGKAGVAMVQELRPDVVLMDMQMPGLNGVQATQAIAGALPEVVVIAMTTFDPDEYLIPVLKAGARGFLVKDARPEEVVQAIRDAHAGATVISPAIAGNLIKAAIADKAAPSTAAQQRLADPLAGRELEVLKLVGRGMNNSDIARDLFITEATVKAHVGRTMAKLQVKNRVQAVVAAARHGLITIDYS